MRSLRDFDRILRLAALRTGQLLNMNALAEVGVSASSPCWRADAHRTSAHSRRTVSA